MNRIRAANLFVWLIATVCAVSHAGERKRIEVTSSLDGHRQPCYLVLPTKFKPQGEPVPLLVSLHSWSADFEQRKPDLELELDNRGWIGLFPNFRGINQTPDACGSPKAQQDILDAVQWAKDNLPVDARRVYLTGVSGGGHMTMLMVAKHPKVWTAASAWVGISDLADWHTTHEADRYGEMMRKCCLGKPGDSVEVDRQYHERSSLPFLHQAVGVPLDICAGVHDGHDGSVPVKHSLLAFNAIAKAAKVAGVSDIELEQISRKNGRLEHPQPGDESFDAVWGRDIYLRRRAGAARVSIFEGGHEGITAAAVAWLEQHQGR